MPEGKRRRWLAPLLWLVIPALAAVAPWLWQRWHAPRRPPLAAAPPLALTGDPRRDRRAILERAADRLLPPGRVLTGSPERAALMGKIGVALLPLDPARGKVTVERAIEMATSGGQPMRSLEIEAPEWSRTGVLVQLARLLKPYPSLAEKALRAGYDSAQADGRAASRVFALGLFARETAGIDPVRARSALQKARGIVYLLPDSAPADPIAAAAAAAARVEGRAAAGPLVERTVRAIPSGRARPLVAARLAAWLVEAAPDRARQLARQAVAQSQGDGQRHAVAVLLAAALPDEALQAADSVHAPAERAAALVEIGNAVEARSPARAEALFRRALRAAEALPEGGARHEAVVAAATGLAAYDLAAARRVVEALPGGAPAIEVMMLGVRAADREPAAAGRLIAKMRDGDPAAQGRIEGSFDLSLAQVKTQPDLRRALAMAQQSRRPELQAEALLVVARRLAGRSVGTKKG